MIMQSEPDVTKSRGHQYTEIDMQFTIDYTCSDCPVCELSLIMTNDECEK
jgi:hypothetical protein